MRKPLGLVAAAAILALGFVEPARAQGANEPQPWALSTDMAYAFEGSGKLRSYKLGTSNAKFLLKGAKKVPKGTLFFIGENGQLYMRSGRYLEGDGRFSFGPS